MIEVSFFPMDINQDKIKEIFEILQSQQRPDLVKEMNNLLLKTIKQCCSKGEETKPNIPAINKVFPMEILKKILEQLDLKSICVARQSCKYWLGLIDGFELVEKISGKKVDVW